MRFGLEFGSYPAEWIWRRWWAAFAAGAARLKNVHCSALSHRAGDGDLTMQQC